MTPFTTALYWATIACAFTALLSLFAALAFGPTWTITAGILMLAALALAVLTIGSDHDDDGPAPRA